MGSGTKKCTVCKTSNAMASLFLCEGIFRGRMTVDWKIIEHYSTAGPNILLKYCLHEKGEERYVKGELFACMQCAKGAIGHCKKMFLGI